MFFNSIDKGELATVVLRGKWKEIRRKNPYIPEEKQVFPLSGSQDDEILPPQIIFPKDFCYLAICNVCSWSAELKPVYL